MSWKDLKKMASDKRFGEIWLRTHTSMGLQGEEEEPRERDSYSPLPNVYQN
jgi:hypothetical protein